MKTTDHFALWAKTKRDEPSVYHPLICHLIDVASVARVLWERVAPKSLRSRVAHGLDVRDPQHLAAWVGFVAGLHDIGKASPGFQAKHGPGWTRVRAAGFSSPLEPRDPGHGTVTALTLQSLLKDDEFGALSRRVIARFVASAVGGHHGVFPGADEVGSANVEAVRGGPDWALARREIARLLAVQTGVFKRPGPTTIDAATATILAGLISVADWIGSDERYFEYAVSGESSYDFNLDEYAVHADEASARALAELGWLDWSPDGHRLSFNDLFPFIEQLRPVQQSVEELEPLTQSPGIAIIEVPMGEGKTEAAFYLADRWSTTAGQNGAYVAMPTMATSNQMFGRMREFLALRYPHSNTNLQLLHSQAALAMDLESRDQREELVVRPTNIHDDRTGQPIVREWFTRRKRGLLAPFGVGTVDQALLAVLSAPHHFVRLFGLAGKTVIFDEVHAYDLYMTALFERLMTWLGALGTSVVILSATLPDQRRRALLDAYAEGASIDYAKVDLAASYPRISWLGTSSGGACEVDTSEAIRRMLEIGWLDATASEEQPWQHLATWLESALANGGCAAVICNTVSHAQEVYRALQDIFPDLADDGEPELDLLHARFPFEERDVREKRALRRFGKPNGVVIGEDGSTVPVRRPRRAVLVATQVIEQSLDLDFDVMVSEIGPVDLLLQRSGRLHRHQRASRPRGLERPKLWLITPDTRDGVPEFQGGTHLIYDEHLLFRTWLALGGRMAIRIPEDMEDLIEAVYESERNPPDDLTPRQTEHWKVTQEKLERDLRTDVEQAHVRRIPRPGSCVRVSDLTRTFLSEDSPELHPAHQALTRLGGPSVSLVCLYKTRRGPATNPDGKEAIDPTVVPDIALARRLLRRSVTVSVPGASHRLLEVEPPLAWRRSSMLRHHRMAVFDQEGRTVVGEVRLRLDAELGLLIE